MSRAQMSGAQKLGAQYSRAQNSALRIHVIDDEDVDNHLPRRRFERWFGKL